MAAASNGSEYHPAEIDIEEQKNLPDIYLEAWKIYDDLDISSLPSNSTEFQNKVKQGMNRFELATRIVSEIGVFSSNEFIEEISTESLRYMMLPFFLGKLCMKLNRSDRSEVLNLAEIYFRDYLQRCQDYEIDGTSKALEKPTKANDSNESKKPNELAELMQAAHSRNDKIAKFREKKELEGYIKRMKVAVQNDNVDDEAKREFFIKLIKLAVIDANDELNSIQLEKQILEMRKTKIYPDDPNNDSDVHPGNSRQHHHQHTHRYQQQPLQPFIITRNAAQKAVFGLGYPSLPVMTVNEFYEERVREGIFPDEEKIAKMNAAQAIAAAQNPNEKEDQEQAVVEEQVERDDDEYLARMRRMDEYKDMVRRGDGNRHNRS